MWAPMRTKAPIMMSHMLGIRKPADHEADGDGLTESCGGAGALDAAFGFGEFATEDAASVERGGGKKIHCAEEQIDPDGGAEEVRGREPGTVVGD